MRWSRAYTWRSAGYWPTVLSPLLVTAAATQMHYRRGLHDQLDEFSQRISVTERVYTVV